MRALRSLPLALAVAAWAPAAGAQTPPVAPPQTVEPVEPPAPPPAVPTGPIAVGKISYTSGKVERAAGRDWSDVTSGPLSTGDRLRTGEDGMARLELSWMTLTLRPSSIVGLSQSGVLSLILEQGGADVRGELIKVTTAEAVVRGEGLAMVRRPRPGMTVAVCGEGHCRVEGGGKTLDLEAGFATIVHAGRPPSPPVVPPSPPTEVNPGDNPLYVKPGTPITLTWKSDAPHHRLEILGIETNEVLMQKDPVTSPTTLTLTWLGLYRWRVYASDDRGIESLPSGEGLICVVDK